MPKTLSTAQENALEAVRVAVGHRATVRETAEIEARRMVRERTREADLIVAQAIKAAVDVGISKRRVGLDGMGTSDYGTVTRTLDLLDPTDTAPARGTAAAAAVTASSMTKVHIATADELKVAGITAHGPVARIDWSDLSLFPGQADPAKGFIDLKERTVLLDELDTDPSVGAIHTLIGKRQRNVLAKELNRLEAQVAAA